jgi:serine-type D-Ala-D-Ala carboxypeptidase/endopeptidase
VLGGPAEALFEIGSITKPLTGVLLADAFLRDEVSLDDPLSTYLSRDEAPPLWPERAPTLAELATHQTGLPNTPRTLQRRELAFVLGLRHTDPWVDVDDRSYRRMLAATNVRRFGGSRYSSIGFGLLGEALARRAGSTYEQLLRARLCEPLGLADTWVEPPPGVRERLLPGHTRRGRPAPPLRDLMPAAGSVRSTTSDMLRLLAAALAPPADAPGPALELAARPREQLARSRSIGLGWLIVERSGKPPLVWHNGGTFGFRSFAGYSPEQGVGAVALTNTLRGVDRLGFKLLDAAAAAA